MISNTAVLRVEAKWEGEVWDGVQRRTHKPFLRDDLPGFMGKRHLPGMSPLKSTGNGYWHQRFG